MKITLTYDLPEDYKDALRAVKSTDLCAFIWEFQQYLRSQYKYADTPDDIGRIYEKWFEMLNEEGIDLDNLYS